MNIELSPFPRRPIPIVGESAYGFERRFAACSRYDSLGAFRHVTGLLDFGPLSVGSKWERMASMAGQPVSELDHMRWIRPGEDNRGRAVQLLGHAIRRTHMSHVGMRFCPECLAEDRGPERRVLRQAWQISLVSACPRHRVLLIDRCDECGDVFDHHRKTKPWACICGREMTSITTKPASDGAVAMSLAFMRHLGIVTASGRLLLDRRGMLPAPFDELSLDDLLSVATRIGLLASTPAADDMPMRPGEKATFLVAWNFKLSVEDAARMMDAAHRVMIGWPGNAHALFASLADRNPATDIAQPVRRIFGTREGYRLLSRLESLSGDPITIIKVELDRWLREKRDVYFDGRRRAKVGVDGDILIDIADALRRLEGRQPQHAIAMRTWEAVGVVVREGKALLSTVEAVASAIARLAESEFEDGIPVEDWANIKMFTTLYRRGDAMRDVLAGTIRVRRDPEAGRSGLAAFLVSRGDLVGRVEAARLAKRGPDTNARKTSPLATKVRKVVEADGFRQPGKLNMLLAEMWPGLEPLHFESCETIRCNYVVRQYHGRDCPMRLYSVVDAIGLVSKTLGPAQI